MLIYYCCSVCSQFFHSARRNQQRYNHATMPMNDDSDDEDLLPSQPTFGQLRTIGAYRPSPTISPNLLSGLFGQAAPDNSRRFDNAAASHAMDPSLLAYLQQNPSTYSYPHSTGENGGLTELVIDEAADSLKRSATTTESLKRSATAESTAEAEEGEGGASSRT
jgi:hypothetical protein